MSTVKENIVCDVVVVSRTEMDLSVKSGAWVYISEENVPKVDTTETVYVNHTSAVPIYAIDCLETRVKNLFKPPFVFEEMGGYIFDSAGEMVADIKTEDSEGKENAVLRMRGWGRLKYKFQGEKLQDAAGTYIAKVLSEGWGKPVEIPKSTFSIVQGILATHSGVNRTDINLMSHLIDDLNFDSLDLIDGILDLEEEFEVEIPDDDVSRMKTVQDLCNFIDKQLSK